jgi:hypothetical protein
VPLGFCSGGFSSTAGYVPGNEARQVFSEESTFERRRAPSKADHFLCGVDRFYPTDQSARGRIGTSLSASAPDVPDGGFPLLPSTNCASPHQFHFPVPVKIPVAISTVKLSLLQIFFESSRKYFKFATLGRRFCAQFVEKAVTKL